MREGGGGVHPERPAQVWFSLSRLRYVETIEDASKMHAAHASFRRVGINDRSGGQESMLEGVNRADIRLWSAAACSHRHRGSRHVRGKFNEAPMGANPSTTIDTC
jgi:hypothetical protein